jgi:hypothetical protein
MLASSWLYASLKRPFGNRADDFGAAGPPAAQLSPKIHSQPPNEHQTRYATPRHLQIGLDQPRKPLARARSPMLRRKAGDDGGVQRMPSALKHRNSQQQNTKR